MLKSIKKSLLLFLIIPFSLTGNAQQKADIGVTFSSIRLMRDGVDFRLPLGEKYRLKFELNQGKYYFRETKRVLSSTDSVVIHRKKNSTQDQWSFYVGADRRIKESIFSLGLDLGFSVMTKKTYISSKPTVLTANGNWELSSFQYNGYDHPVVIGEDNFAHTQDWYLIPSVRASLSMDLPIGQFFIFKVRGVFGIQKQIYNGDSNKHPTSDPFNEFSKIKHHNFSTFQKSVNFGMSYVIGGYKSWKSMRPLKE